jgi:hypothetical protein
MKILERRHSDIAESADQIAQPSLVLPAVPDSVS